MNRSNEILIYIDGACSSNQLEQEKRIMGIGCVLLYKGNPTYIQKRVKDDNKSNQRAELYALLAALKRINSDGAKHPIRVRTDSAYVIGCMTGWKRKVNLDLFIKLDEQKKRFSKLEFEQLKGHSGDEMNELADSLAVEATKGEREEEEI